MRTPALLSAVLLALAALPAVAAFQRPPDAAPEDVVVPMLFPVAGETRWNDTFGAPRDGGKRQHRGQDLVAPQMTPLVAVFDGVVTLRPGGSKAGNTLTLEGDNGYRAIYMHINNDTPGTDDGLGTEQYAFAPGLKTGDHVTAGQFLAWVGDSGNAEDSSPHCHFELWGPEGCLNPAPSLLAAVPVRSPLAAGAESSEPLQAGEKGWDGVVKSYHPEWRMLVLQLHATREPGGRVRPVRKPATMWIRLNGASLRDFSGATVEESALLPGVRVSVIGREAGPKKASLARLAAVDLGERVPVPAGDEAATPMAMAPAGPPTITPSFAPAMD